MTPRDIDALLDELQRTRLERDRAIACAKALTELAYLGALVRTTVWYTPGAREYRAHIIQLADDDHTRTTTPESTP